MLAVPGPDGFLLNEGKEEKKREKKHSVLSVSCNMYKYVWHNTEVFQIGFCFLFLFFFFHLFE